jgi:polyisoprenyl-phosphate glycosyltransferase
MRAKSYLLSVVVPAYNEQEVIDEFHRRLSAVCQGIDGRVEIVYVNDGSKDGTLSVLQRLHSNDKRVTVVNLSRNFGKEIALTAGLDHARGEAIVVIDADLQDPPELIPEFIAQWRRGFDVVYGQRSARAGESWVKRLTAHTFYRLIGRISRVKIPADTGDFRLMSRRAVEAVLKLREQHRFMKGVFAWVGFPQTALLYTRDARAAGKTKWNYWKLWNLAIEGITSFSIGPLKIATYFGFAVALLSFVYGAWIILKTLLWGESVAGYPTIMVTVLFLGGAQLMSIGILGEYLGRIFNEVKQRPLYFVERALIAEGEGDIEPRRVGEAVF